jgi:hypothetical protein
MLVSSDRHRVSSEVLTLEFDVDHPLDQADRNALVHVGSRCRDYASAADRERLAAAFDVALAELGGEENICAG